MFRTRASPIDAARFLSFRTKVPRKWKKRMKRTGLWWPWRYPGEAAPPVPWEQTLFGQIGAVLGIPREAFMRRPPP